ncbi:MAG: arylsulfatase [Bacteroidota bacterium]
MKKTTNKSRNKISYFTLILLLVTLSFSSCDEPFQPPNVILIVTDDQGYGDVGFHGNSIVQTPRLDAFSKSAVELTNFHVGTTCTPTRAGIMTGRNANRNGAWHTIAGASILNEDEQTIAQVFQEAGYQTGMFGKWHLGDSYPYRPHDRGFDEAFYHGGGGVQQTPDYWNNDYFDDTYLRNGTSEKTEGYCTDVWFTELIRFIKGNKEKPFFTYLATNAAHGPFNVPEEYHKMYEAAALKPRQVNFYGMLSNLDDNFGKLEDFLKENGLFENTILIYTTDNGTAGGVSYDKQTQKTYGFNPLKGTKGSHYDGGHRVPFLMSWPKGKLQGGKKIATLTAHVDLLPTLTKLARINFQPSKKLDGMDLSAGLLKDGAESDRMLVVDTQRDQWPKKYKNPCVMQGDWRLVNHKELYNTQTDLAQKNDVSDQFPEKVKAMQEFYDTWWESTTSEWKHSPTYLGTAEENPVLITIHDMHPHKQKRPIPWNQNQVRKGEVDTEGYYEVKVASAGNYQFGLSRWPQESKLNLSDSVDAIPETDYVYGLQKGKSLSFDSAYVKVGSQLVSVKVVNNAPSATLQLSLEKGADSLEAWFQTPSGEYFPAYYVSVTKN